VPFIRRWARRPNGSLAARLWGSPDVVVARAVEPIKQLEHYLLRRAVQAPRHVCKVLHAAVVPLLVGRVPSNYEPRLKIAKRLDDAYGPLKRRIDAHGVDVRSPRGLKYLSGGAFGLEVTLALAGRTLVTP